MVRGNVNVIIEEQSLFLFIEKSDYNYKLLYLNN